MQTIFIVAVAFLLLSPWVTTGPAPDGGLNFRTMTVASNELASAPLLHLFVGYSKGNTVGFENWGDASEPVWTRSGAWHVPKAGKHAVPAFADLDGDGDRDVMLGTSGGRSKAYLNTGTVEALVWTEKDAWGLPDVGKFAAPSMADWDGDGDVDALVGNKAGMIQAFENTGSIHAPIWTPKAAWGLVVEGQFVAPVAFDMDNDGDLDLLVGTKLHGVLGVRNDGSAAAPVWMQNPAWDGPAVGKFTKVTIGDLDGDGDPDLLVGEATGRVSAYENTGSIGAPVWTANTAWNAEDLGARSAPTLAAFGPGQSLTLTIEDYVQMPRTRPDSIPLTKKTPNQRPNFLREEPGGADRLFVNDLYGFIFTIDKATRAVATYLDFINIFPHFRSTGSFGAGLVTFAFHPDFASNGKFYTVHTEMPHANGETPVVNPPVGIVANHNVLIEWTATDPAAGIFSGTRREILRVGTTSPLHPMGDVGFNPLAAFGDPDYGLLYISLGDGEAPKNGGTQRLDTLLGTILRIDPDPNGQPIRSGNEAYSIPEDNPWASDGDANTRGEIYAYGFRNVHRMSWDTQTGDLYAMDIGEKTWEEVNRIEPGRNYGWRDREGTTLVGGEALPFDDSGYSYPVAQYAHDAFSFPVPNKIGISSGFVYRGAAVPSLQGKLIVGDIPNGLLFYVDADELQGIDVDDPTTTATIHQLQIVYEGQARELIDIVSDALGTTAGRVDLRFGSDAAGELYIITKQDGFLRRVVP